MARLLDEYFSTRARKSADLAWVDVYLLCSWTDPSTGLAHCYEGDESQPPQRWHERALEFHAWLGASLEASGLTRRMGWLFQPPEGGRARGPGEDPELPSILTEALRRHYAVHASPEEREALIERVQRYLELESNRRGLVDAGFADVLADIIRRVLRACLTCARLGALTPTPRPVGYPSTSDRSEFALARWLAGVGGARVSGRIRTSPSARVFARRFRVLTASDDGALR